MIQHIQNLLAARSKREEGASAVEYGLLVAGIAAVIVAAVFLFGGFINNMFNSTCAKIQNGSNTASTATSCTN